MKNEQNLSRSANQPVSSNSERDGNLAFKVTYTDSNWNGVCSSEVAAYNCQKRTWCKKQKGDPINCQSPRFSDPDQLSINNTPCMDSIAQKELAFYAGHFHGPEHNNEPMKCLYAKEGKIAVFTSRENGEPEDQRFIFAIGQISLIEIRNDGVYDFDVFYCDKSTALVFSTNRPKFWDYYSNENNPDRAAWNMKLYRYLDDETISVLLKDISDSNRFPNKVKRKAEYLLEQL